MITDESLFDRLVETASILTSPLNIRYEYEKKAMDTIFLQNHHTAGEINGITF